MFSSLSCINIGVQIEVAEKFTLYRFLKIDPKNDRRYQKSESKSSFTLTKFVKVLGYLELLPCATTFSDFILNIVK